MIVDAVRAACGLGSHGGARHWVWLASGGCRSIDCRPPPVPWAASSCAPLRVAVADGALLRRPVADGDLLRPRPPAPGPSLNAPNRFDWRKLILEWKTASTNYCTQYQKSQSHGESTSCIAGCFLLFFSDVPIPIPPPGFGNDPVWCVLAHTPSRPYPAAGPAAPLSTSCSRRPYPTNKGVTKRDTRDRRPPACLPWFASPSSLDGELHDGVDDVAIVPLERRDGLGAGAAGLIWGVVCGGGRVG